MMDVLVCFHRDERCNDYSEDLLVLSKQVELVELNDFCTIIQIANKKKYRLVVLLSLDCDFPESWNVNEIRTRCPVIMLTGVQKVNITFLTYLIEMLSTGTVSTFGDPLFTKSLAFIEENIYDNDLSLEKVASKFFVSRCHYSRMFQKYIGTGFKEYIMNKRIQKARLLLHKGESVTDVCFSVGYNDLTHFGRVFKRVVGINPSIYRKKGSQTLFQREVSV